jgi:hypothetical protein
MNADPFVNSPVNVAIMATNFFSIAWGFIFKDMLEYEVAQWDANRKTQTEIAYRRPRLVIAYLGLCAFLILFLASCFAYISFSPWLAIAVAIPTVGVVAILIWVQLGAMLQLLVRGGSAALSIDVTDAVEELEVEQRD